MLEQPPSIEKEPYLKKHNKWLQEAKIAARSILVGTGGTIIGIEILRTLIPEFNLPLSAIIGMAGGLTGSLHFTHERKED